jgi:hypothetical protein
MKELFVLGLESALALREHETAERLLAVVEGLPPGRLPQVLQAQGSRFRARLAAERGGAGEAERLFKRAAGLFRELAMPFYLACTQLQHGEFLLTQGRAAEAEVQVGEARRAFEELRARPWLERCDAAIPGGARVHAEAT